ncbi:unnamed protein product, partial [Mesorhabditis belari]|uniref:28S ribosomal protein S22, mitochondrial n=1 Tax=Mesorhabditis belari TaxID=2138241 RepID=A0AAF3J4I4_9BILA
MLRHGLFSRLHRLQALCQLHQPQSSSLRLASAWINPLISHVDPGRAQEVNAEKLFTSPEVQELLTKLTGADLQNKIFRSRRISTPQNRSHYALMTDERWEKTMERMQEEAQHFLQFIPLKEPRVETTETLIVDKEIAGFDKSKFVFTDISFDATDQDRTVVVREVDGSLRTATPEEHDRMNRVYYEKSNRPVVEPAVFSDPYLQDALDRNEHEFLMDWACMYFEVDDPKFISLSKTVYDRIIATKNFDSLYSTRHFGTLVFYLAINNNLPPLLNFFANLGQLSECASLVRLQKSLYPDWRLAIGSYDSDFKILQDYVKQNTRFKQELGDVASTDQSDVYGILKGVISTKLPTLRFNVTMTLDDCFCFLCQAYLHASWALNVNDGHILDELRNFTLFRN